MRLLSTIAMFAIVLGCGIISAIFGDPQPYIQREVSRTELVGAWQATPQSAAYKNQFTHEHPDWPITTPWRTMVLNPDGSCQVTIEPGWRGSTRPEYTLSSCTWDLSSHPNIDEKPVTSLHMAIDGFGESWLYVYEENGGLTLWDFIGDADDFATLDYRHLQP